MNRLIWGGHVQRIDDERTLVRIKKHKPIGKRKRGRRTNRWLDQFGSDARKPVSYTHLDVYKRQIYWRQHWITTKKHIIPYEFRK